MRSRSLTTAAAAVVAAVAVLFSAATAVPSSADVEHTFVVSTHDALVSLLATSIRCHSVNIARPLVLSKLCCLFVVTHAWVRIGERGEHDAHVQGDVGRCGERSATGAGDRSD
jgi:hypothetical protein